MQWERGPKDESGTEESGLEADRAGLGNLVWSKCNWKFPVAAMWRRIRRNPGVDLGRITESAFQSSRGRDKGDRRMLK